MANTVIKIEGLYKKFCISLKRSMYYGTIDAAKNMLGLKDKSAELRKNEFWAIQDINFELRQGESLGLIGQNGCGKSTLLRLINGIFPPDKGKIEVIGRIGALIAVGAGFHPHMTGRENIYLNGTILGMKKHEIKSKFDEIVDFAEIGDFLDAPVANYSSGMHVRLGFAIAINCNPEILLVDEILAVGDAKFQRKCLDKLNEVRKNGVAFFLVSHNLQNIDAMCEKALLLEKGAQLNYGLTQEIIPKYELLLLNHSSKVTNTPMLKQSNIGLNLISQYRDFGTDEISISEFVLYDKQNLVKTSFEASQLDQIIVKFSCKNKIEKAFLLIRFTYIYDVLIKENNISALGIRNQIEISEGQNSCRIKMPAEVSLATGRYQIGLYFMDESYLNPYYQGEFGYVYIENTIPTMLQTGRSTPLIWLS